MPLQHILRFSRHASQQSRVAAKSRLCTLKSDARWSQKVVEQPRLHVCLSKEEEVVTASVLIRFAPLHKKLRPPPPISGRLITEDEKA